MRCSRRSIRSFASAAAAWLAIAASAAAADASGGGVVDEGRVRLAIEDAVRQRVGRGAEVTVVALLDVRLAAAARAIVASPAPHVRFGEPGRFLLFAEGGPRIRVGEATAVVAAVAEVVRLRRPVSRGEAIDLGEVEVVRAALGGPISAPPALDDVAGARARRDLAAGSTLSTADIAAEPAVRAGDPVRAVVRVGSGEVAAAAVAMQSGARGDIVLVANREGRRAMRGRVIARGVVEVLDVR